MLMNIMILIKKNGWSRISYYIGYDVTEMIWQNPAVQLRRLNEVYFSSKEIAEDAANKVGAKRIIKYLFDVDCEVDE